MGFAYSASAATNEKRVMVFVDGTNFLTRLGEHLGLDIDPHAPPEPALSLASALNVMPYPSLVRVRSYWIGSYHGTEETEQKLLTTLHRHSFDATLFRKERRKASEKGVDMGLAVELLMNAFHRNFDIGILVAGDEDYVRLVHEAKRYGGASVWGRFFAANGMSAKLKLALDHFEDFSDRLGGPSYEKHRADLATLCKPPTDHKARDLERRAQQTRAVDDAISVLGGAAPDVPKAIELLRALRDQISPPTTGPSG